MLESPQIRAWRRAYRTAFGRAETLTETELREHLARALEVDVLRNLVRLVETDPHITRDGDRLYLDQAAVFGVEIATAIVSDLTRRSAPWDSTSSLSVNVGPTRGFGTDAFVPAALQAVAGRMLDEGELRVLPNGQLALVDPWHLPQIAPRSTPTEDTDSPVTASSTHRLSGVEVRRGGPLIESTLQTSIFRALRLTVPLPSRAPIVVSCAAVEIHDTTALVVAYIGDLTDGQRSDLETGDWWFWDPEITSPLGRPATRTYACEFATGQPSLNIFATTSPGAAMEALLTLTQIAGLRLSARVEVEFDIAPLAEYDVFEGGDGGGGYPRGPRIGTCLECGQPLTDPESALRGYGPLCWERLLDLYPEMADSPFSGRSQEIAYTDSGHWVAPLQLSAWEEWVGLR
ncbi:DUF6011 domain-containing protein [Sanguibacter suarezii]|uniref:DUF6011 domain-containing protein n=1 Tax=Sanguibacter suarezii TaxID=60921 RepID=UPI000B049CC6